MSDTHPLTNPPSKADQVKTFIADLARPFAIYTTSAGATAGFIIVAMKVENGNDGAIYLGAVGVIIGLLIGARAVENINRDKRSAEVEVAKVNAGAPTP